MIFGAILIRIAAIVGTRHQAPVSIGRALAAVTLLASAAVSGSPLFEDDSILEIRLSGPLTTIIKNKQNRDQHPFVLTIDDTDIEVKVRVRGNSRLTVCRFPPLRLNFSRWGTRDTIFAGQDKLKLVTHCKSDNLRAANNVLDEYLAYRLFNLMSDASYQVRLIRVTYEDTEGKQKGLESAQYGFVIESDRELAARLDGKAARISGVLYSRLDESQTALMFVFQYLIGNTDWSLVTASTSNKCCHNVGLIDIDNDLITVPYDFDMSGLVDAVYAKPDPSTRAKRVTQRVYRGYCKSPPQSIETALQDVKNLRDDILAVSENTPALDKRYAKWRLQFLERFFAEAEDEKKLLSQFSRQCLGTNSS